MSESGEGRSASLIEDLRKLEALFRDDGDVRAADQARELARKLAENQFQVVVMGEFKRGKSSLINALIGRPLLPVAAVPLTSVVTVVRHGSEARAFVEFQGGHHRETAIGSIVDFISEERNPKNEKRVKRVVVEAPAPFLADGTLLVDTPGSGSVYRHNTEVAQKYMPEADAVILVLSADPPISQAEVEFLHSVRRWARKLFVVQNKTDYLEPSDLQASLEFTRKVMENALGDQQAPVIPISAKLALQGRSANDDGKVAASGLGELESQLHGFLAVEKARVLRQTVVSRAAGLADRAIFDIDLRLRVAQATADEWKMLSKKIRESVDDAKRQQFELTALYNNELKLHEKAVEQRLYESVRALTASAKAGLETAYRSIKAESAGAVREKLNEVLMARVEGSFAELLEKEEPAWSAQFQAITDRYLQKTVDVVNDTISTAAKALDLQSGPIGKPPLDIAPPSVWFIVDKVSAWSGGFGSVPTLRLFKPFFWKAVQKKLTEAMDLNAGRLRYDYSVRLERAGDEATELIEGFFESCLDSLAKACAASSARESGESARVDSARVSFEHQREALLTLRDTLNSIDS